MGRAAKWLRQLLSGKKERVPAETRSGPLPMPAPKEKKRWSFRRSVTGTAMEQKSAVYARAHIRGFSESDMDPKRQESANAAVIRLTNRATETVEEAAAVRIQSVFRSYLARRALCALKGLVTLQALIRGHLVRRQATATLRRVRAMVSAPARARTQRLRMLEESQGIEIVEMDVGESRGNSKGRSGYAFVQQTERRDRRLATYSAGSTPYKRDPCREALSPARSAFADRSPRARSGHFGEYYSIMQEGSPPCSIHDFMKPSLAPGYMANTESSRAKARSHSAPKQRLDPHERPPSRRRPSVEGRSGARGARTQRSSSHMIIKLDRSSISLQESDCGSTSTLLTNTRSVVSYL